MKIGIALIIISLLSFFGSFANPTISPPGAFFVFIFFMLVAGCYLFYRGLRKQRPELFLKR